MSLFDWRVGKKAKAVEEAKDQAVAEKNQAVIAKERAEKELQEVIAKNERKEFFVKQQAEKESQDVKAENARKEFFAKQQAEKDGVKAATGAVSGASSGSVIAEYTVKEGDTLSQIAKNFYGVTGPEYWNLIQAANKDLIKDVNMIDPGQVFKIPALPEELKKK